MTGAVVVRRAEPADAPTLGGLIARFLAEEDFPGDAGVAGGRASGFLADDHNVAFLAVAGTEAVGVATVTTTFGFEMGRYAELEDLFVVPEWRRQGIGRALVEAAVAWAEQAGCTVVEIVVTPDGDARHRLGAWYLGSGFVETGRRILHRFAAEPPTDG